MKKEFCEILEIIDLRLEILAHDLKSQNALIEELLALLKKDDNRKVLENILCDAWRLPEKK